MAALALLASSQLHSFGSLAAESHCAQLSALMSPPNDDEGNSSASSTGTGAASTYGSRTSDTMTSPYKQQPQEQQEQKERPVVAVSNKDFWIEKRARSLARLLSDERLRDYPSNIGRDLFEFMSQSSMIHQTPSVAAEQGTTEANLRGDGDDGLWPGRDIPTPATSSLSRCGSGDSLSSASGVASGGSWPAALAASDTVPATAATVGENRSVLDAVDDLWLWNSDCCFPDSPGSDSDLLDKTFLPTMTDNDEALMKAVVTGAADKAIRSESAREMSSFLTTYGQMVEGVAANGADANGGAESSWSDRDEESEDEAGERSDDDNVSSMSMGYCSSDDDEDDVNDGSSDDNDDARKAGAPTTQRRSSVASAPANSSSTRRSPPTLTAAVSIPSSDPTATTASLMPELTTTCAVSVSAATRHDMACIDDAPRPVGVFSMATHGMMHPPVATLHPAFHLIPHVNFPHPGSVVANKTTVTPFRPPPFYHSLGRDDVANASAPAVTTFAPSVQQTGNAGVSAFNRRGRGRGDTAECWAGGDGRGETGSGDEYDEATGSYRGSDDNQDEDEEEDDGDDDQLQSSDGPPSVRVRRVTVDRKQKQLIPKPLQLWEFLLHILELGKHRTFIDWIDRDEGSFKIHDSVSLGKRWGTYRHKPHMNYDKMSRAMRYYYKRKIFVKIEGRLLYRFSQEVMKQVRTFRQRFGVKSTSVSRGRR